MRFVYMYTPIISTVLRSRRFLKLSVCAYSSLSRSEQEWNTMWCASVEGLMCCQFWVAFLLIMVVKSDWAFVFQSAQTSSPTSSFINKANPSMLMELFFFFIWQPCSVKSLTAFLSPHSLYSDPVTSLMSIFWMSGRRSESPQRRSVGLTLPFLTRSSGKEQTQRESRKLT